VLQTVIDELLDCWTGKDQPRDGDFSPKMWTHALRQLPAYLASVGRWKDLIRIAGDGFLERKLVELKSLSLVDADSELVFLACMKVRDLAAAVRLVLRRSQAEQKAHTIEEEGVAEALFNAAVYTGNKALLQELLFWHELLPMPERRLKVLANLLTASTGNEWTTEILKAVVRSLPERGGTLSADLDLRRIMEAVLARGETNIGFAIGVLWPRFSSTAAVGDLSTIPTTWTKNNRPQTPTIADRLISVLEKVAPEQRTYWLRELSARLNHLPFERQWAVRVRVAQAQCSCGEFETARESFIAAHDALNRGIQAAKGTHAQEQFSKLLAVVVTYEALLHAALLSLPENLRLEAEERINWNLVFPNPMSEPFYFYLAFEYQGQGIDTRLIDECLARSCSEEATSLFSLPLRYAARICREKGDRQKALEAIGLAFRALYRPGIPGNEARGILRLAEVGEELQPGVLGPMLWRQAIEALPSTNSSWETAFEAYCDFAAHAHLSGGANDAPRLLEMCLEIAGRGPTRGERIIDREERKSRFHKVISAFADGIQNRVLLDFSEPFAELLPEESVKDFLSDAARAILKTSEVGLAREWLEILFRIATTYSLVDELADTTVREIAKSPLPAELLGTYGGSALRRWSDERSKWSEALFAAAEKMRGRATAITLAEAGLNDKNRKTVALCIGQLFRMGVGELAVSAAFSFLTKRPEVDSRKPVWTEMARTAHRLRLREEADHWLSKASADTVEEKILLAKSSLDAGVSEHASRLANELFATLGTPAAEKHIPEIVDVIVAVDGSRNPTRILQLFERLSGNLSIGTIGDLVITLAREAEGQDADTARTLLGQCTSIAEQMPFAHDKASLGTICKASAVIIAGRAGQTHEGVRQFEEGLRTITTFYEAAPVRNSDAVLAMQLTAMARGPFPKADILGMLDAFRHGRSEARPEDFFFYSGLQACIRAAEAVSAIQNGLGRIRTASKKLQHMGYLALLQNELALAYGKQGHAEQSRECFDDLTQTISSIANNAEMLSSVQARVCELYLRFRGCLPAEAPSSADQCLSVAEALERAERGLAPSDLDQVVAKLLNGIARLPSSDVWAPLTRTVSVFAGSDPAQATEAYRVLKQSQ
jgi:tetratricopeptide (TPR) repeat protein